MQKEKQVTQREFIRAIQGIETWSDGSPSSHSMEIYMFFRQHFERTGLYVGDSRKENEISRGLQRVTEEFDAGHISLQKMKVVFEQLRQAIVDTDYTYITSNDFNSHSPLHPWEVKANELAIKVLTATSFRYLLHNDSFAETRVVRLSAFEADLIIKSISPFISDTPGQQRLLLSSRIPITEKLYAEYKETLERAQHR